MHAQVHSRRGRCQAFIVRADNRPIIIGLAADSGMSAAMLAWVQPWQLQLTAVPCRMREVHLYEADDLRVWRLAKATSR